MRLTGGPLSEALTMTARECFAESLAAEVERGEAYLEAALGLARLELAAGDKAAARRILEPKYRLIEMYPELALTRTVREALGEAGSDL